MPKLIAFWRRVVSSSPCLHTFVFLTKPLIFIIVLFIYDALITFDREVLYFWTARWTGASLLFVVNRYISMTLYVMEVCLWLYGLTVDDPDSAVRRSCTRFSLVTYAFEILQFVPWAVFSALRTYVLSRKKIPGLLILALSTMPTGVNLVAIYAYGPTGISHPPFGCLLTTSMTRTEAQRFISVVVILARVPLIVADIMLIYITWTNLSRRSALQDLRRSKRLSFSDVLFRSGILDCYVIRLLFTLNVLHLAFSLTTVWSMLYLTVRTALMPFITAILVSRFLIQLQEVNHAVVPVDPDDPLHSSRDPYSDTPSFISSLGGFINPDVRAASTEEESELREGPHSGEESEARPSESQTAPSSSFV
ncbi:hypothetical protein L227DRAFT_550006 [Lentinus tigrinus ALCF2SS1-6]|uniref:DUF6533 domain-containing protein n=1 Tax=Lentinus tigrinus ALCF2SS1-6 TaxID=1328759 RepID=A0A5C2S5L9_9APHY|nr:hypothetical protein L227DRAFT_550006 [Lentinus tigrinus ALCF2SS1-6]